MAVISKVIALNILDGMLLTLTTLLLLVIAGIPAEWLLQLADMALREFQWIAPVIIISMAWLIYAIATSDGAPAAGRDE
jgi:hypothetical protein